MKAILFTIMLLLSSVAYADDTVNLVIRQKAGNETILSLDSNPIITFEGEYLKVNCNFGMFSYPLADIDQYSISSNTSDVKEMRSYPHYSNGQVHINDLPIGTKAFVYSLDGKVIREMDIDDSGTMTFNLNDLPKGTYIISAASTRFKISHK